MYYQSSVTSNHNFNTWSYQVLWKGKGFLVSDTSASTTCMHTFCHFLFLFVHLYVSFSSSCSLSVSFSLTLVPGIPLERIIIFWTFIPYCYSDMRKYLSSKFQSQNWAVGIPESCKDYGLGFWKILRKCSVEVKLLF